MLNKTQKLALLLCQSLFALQTVSAQTPASETKKEEEVKESARSGIIASQGHVKDFAAIDVDTTGSAPGDSVNVISGSVKRDPKGNCIVTVTNNGQKDYSLSFSLLGIDPKTGRKSMDKFYSATLKSKESTERRVSSCSDKLNLAVKINSVKALANKKDEQAQ